MGIGPIPDSVLSCLENHKDLSVATEVLSDGAMTLLEKGVVTNRYKKFHPGKSTCTFILGSKALYDFVDDNPNILALDVVTTNDPALIRQNPRMCAVNSALEIDLTGQICADSLGTMQYSGVGGQMDFMRGAALSEQGKPIIVLPSQTSKGISRIVNTVGLEGVREGLFELNFASSWKKAQQWLRRVPMCIMWSRNTVLWIYSVKTVNSEPVLWSISRIPIIVKHWNERPLNVLKLSTNTTFLSSYTFDLEYPKIRITILSL